MNPFELHVEKITLSVAVLALLGVGAWEFVLSEDKVNVGGDPTEISEINVKLSSKARAIQEELAKKPLSDPFVEKSDPKAEPPKQDLATQLTGPVVTKAVPLLEPSFAALLVRDGDAREFTYHIPSLPAPAELSVGLTHDAIETSQAETYKAHLPPQVFRPGGDVTWTTPSATLDPAAIRSQLGAANGEESSIPARWWENTILIPDMVFERQERNEDGTWSALTVVDPMGTLVNEQLSFRSDFAKVPLEPGLRETVVETLKEEENQQEILRPEFYPTRHNHWLEPTDEPVSQPKTEAELAALSAMKKLQTDLSKLKRRKDSIEKELKELGGPLKQSDSDGKKKGSGSGEGGGGGDGGGFGGGFGGGGGMKGRRDPDAGNDEKTKDLRIRKTKELESIVKDLETTTKALQDLAGKAPEGDTQSDFELNGDKPVRVWTHDVKVEPGKTYRYRCTIKLLNPFFGKNSVLNKAQQSLADSPTISSAPSEWSNPVTVPPEIEIFATGAKTGTDRRADFEIYRLYGGTRWSESFGIVPGEVIGDVKKRAGVEKDEDIDFSTDWFLVDVCDGGVGPTDAPNDDSAQVVIQNRAGKVIEYRVPKLDKASAARNKLIQEVKLNENENAPGGKPPSDDGAPTGPGGGPAGGPGA
jgi:uncharacterized membrane protein YgcG